MAIVRYPGETDAELRARIVLPTVHHAKLKAILAKLGIKSAGSKLVVTFQNVYKPGVY